MKAFALLSLLGLVSSQSNLQPCFETDPDCEPKTGAGYICVYRFVQKVVSSSKKYKAAKKIDKDLVKNKATFKCYTLADSEKYMALSGKKDSATDATCTYKLYPVPTPTKASEVGLNEVIKRYSVKAPDGLVEMIFSTYLQGDTPILRLTMKADKRPGDDWTKTGNQLRVCLEIGLKDGPSNYKAQRERYRWIKNTGEGPLEGGVQINFSDNVASLAKPSTLFCLWQGSGSPQLTNSESGFTMGHQYWDLTKGEGYFSVHRPLATPWDANMNLVQGTAYMAIVSAYFGPPGGIKIGNLYGMKEITDAGEMTLQTAQKDGTEYKEKGASSGVRQFYTASALAASSIAALTLF